MCRLIFFTNLNTVSHIFLQMLLQFDSFTLPSWIFNNMNVRFFFMSLIFFCIVFLPVFEHGYFIITYFLIMNFSTSIQFAETIIAF